MFYCEPCRTSNDWPESFRAKSLGRCENCGQQAVCHDAPSHLLADPAEAAAAEQRLRAIGGGPVLDAIRSDAPAETTERLMEEFARNDTARQAILGNAVILPPGAQN